MSTNSKQSVPLDPLDSKIIAQCIKNSFIRQTFICLSGLYNNITRVKNILPSPSSFTSTVNSSLLTSRTIRSYILYELIFHIVCSMNNCFIELLISALFYLYTGNIVSIIEINFGHLFEK